MNDKVMLAMIRSADEELKILGFRMLCEGGLECVKDFFYRNGELVSPPPHSDWIQISKYYIRTTTGGDAGSIYHKELDIIFTNTGHSIILWKFNDIKRVKEHNFIII